MALSMTMKVGDHFNVGDKKVYCQHVFGPQNFVLTVDGSSVDVVGTDWTPIMDGVSVAASFSSDGSKGNNRVRVAIRAPGLRIERGGWDDLDERVNGNQ